MTVAEALPWHTQQWSLFLTMRRRGTLPHALLLHGRAGLGKARFAGRVAGSLLCESPDGEGRVCGRCRSCELYEAGTHPDHLRVVPEEEGKEIRIDQVREITGFTALKCSHGAHKVVEIAPAERMNRHAANSLLKTLEEPPADTLLLLVSHSPALLPATIRSRCQRLAFGAPPEDEATRWLEARLPPGTAPEVMLRLANRSPFHALELAGTGALSQRDAVLRDVRALCMKGADPVAVAAGWNDLGLRTATDWLYVLVTDLIRLKQGAAAPEIVNRDAKPELQPLCQGLELKLLFKLLDKCLESRRALERHWNLNPQLQLEDLAITWTGS